ncbi:MAG: PilZ domain-containing protein [Solirubrobacteraceae bacterium]
MTRRPLSWIGSRRPTFGVPGQLTTGEGQTLSVSISTRGKEMLLALFVSPGSLLDGQQEELVLESITSRGLMRVRGSVERVEQDLVRFQPSGDPDLIQRREFVRVTAPLRVTLDDLAGLVLDTHCVNVSGGGILVPRRELPLALETPLQFSLDLGPRQTPVVGTGKVVRAVEDDQLGILFTEISHLERDRLIRFLFDRQRRALAVTRGDAM